MNRQTLLNQVVELDQTISVEHGEEAVGFNEAFLLAMDDEELLEVYHEYEKASNKELDALITAMKDYAKNHNLVIS
jgi:hypothetical protein